MNKGSKTLFYDTVQHLCLTIDLRMVGGAHPQGHATEPKQVLLEAAQKQGTMVCDQAPRHAVNFTHDIHEENDNWMSGVMDG